MNVRAISVSAGVVFGLAAVAVGEPPADPWYFFCGSPIATCDQPRPSSAIDRMRGGAEAYSLVPPLRKIESGDLRLPVVAPVVGTEPDTAPPKRRRSVGPQPVPHKERHEVRAVLGLWQAATSGALPATDAEQLRLAQRREDLTGGQRVIVGEFRGPVDAAALWLGYDWTLKKQGKTCELIATPTGTLDRLLCGRIAIKLDSHKRPVSLAFLRSEGQAGRAVAWHTSSAPDFKVVTAYYTPAATDGMVKPASATEAMVSERSIVSEPGPRLLRVEGDFVFPTAPTGGVLLEGQ